MEPNLRMGFENPQSFEGLDLRKNTLPKPLDKETQSAANARLCPLIREDLLGQIPRAEIVDQKPVGLFLEREKDPIPLSKVDLFGKLNCRRPYGYDAQLACGMESFNRPCVHCP